MSREEQICQCYLERREPKVATELACPEASGSRVRRGLTGVELIKKIRKVEFHPFQHPLLLQNIHCQDNLGVSVLADHKIDLKAIGEIEAQEAAETLGEDLAPASKNPTIKSC